jgi:flavodoxin
MRVLIIYDTVSTSKKTATVAETIREVLKEKGLEADALFVADADKAVVENYDCLLAGAPTMIFRASRRIMQFLDKLPKAGFSGKTAAAFGTQLESRVSGSSVKGIEGKLKGLGFRVVASPLVAYVGRKEGRWRLKDGELEKTRKWAQEIAEVLSH